MTKPKVVETTRHVHHEITDGSPPDTQRILHHPAAFDTTIHMLDPYAPTSQCLIRCLLLRSEVSTTGFLDRLPHLHPIQREGEKA